MIEPRIDHVSVDVADLSESIEFYRAMFGFEVLKRREDGLQAFVGRGEIVLGLLENPDLDYSRSTVGHIAFPCSRFDFPQMVDRIKASGAPIVRGPEPQREGETVWFRDPSGNIIEICYPPLRF